jgi:hypothetical protein
MKITRDELKARLMDILQESDYPTIRSKDELIDVLLVNKDKFNSGLCLLITALKYHDLISLDEMVYLNQLLIAFEPVNKWNTIYWWKVRKWYPRKRFLLSLKDKRTVKQRIALFFLSIFYK